MDPVTHMLTGACLSRAGLNRKTGLSTLTIILALEAPDIDSLWYFAGSVAGLQHHRGITHSFVGAPFVAALVTAGVYGVYRWMKRSGREPKLPPNWRLLYFYALAGALLHLFQDFTNNYGIRPFAPFNSKWYSWDIVFIVDPIMLLALFVGLVVPGLFALVTEEIGSRKPPLRGRGGAVSASMSGTIAGLTPTSTMSADATASVLPEGFSSSATLVTPSRSESSSATPTP